MQYTRLRTLQTWLRRLLYFTFVMMAVIAVVGYQRGTLAPDRMGRVLGRMTGLPGLPVWQVAIIAGHRGNDTGAVCEDGLMEVTITQAVANRVAGLLDREAVQVQVLDEYDKRLAGLQTDALVSIHVDSCVPLSGYKVASPAASVIADEDDRLATCVSDAYADATGLPYHSNTVTHNMTGYHAFQRVAATTPGTIIELGFLGGDREILVNGQGKMARGITDGILCFLRNAEEASTEASDAAPPDATTPDASGS